MGIVFNYNNLNTTIYIKYYCSPSFIQNKPSLNYFMRENAKNALKTLKMQLSPYIEEYDYCFQF